MTQPLADQLEIPLVVAPMFLVSSPALTLAACAEGVVGSFPAHATRTREDFKQWLDEIERGLAALRDNAEGRKIAPYAVNLVTHATNDRMEGDLELCIQYKVPIVLTSKSAPTEAVRRIQDYGGVVFHDIASRRHAQKALEAGVDGLIVVAAGAGGHTGTINPFALMNEVRQVFDGPIILAGGMTTGRDVLAAQAMGADFAYMGTRFIPTEESLAAQRYKQMIVDSNANDIFFTASLDGAPANFLVKTLLDAGIDLDVLRTTLPGRIISTKETSKRWKDIWAAGHGVGNIARIAAAADVVREIKQEYQSARMAWRTSLM